MASVLAHHLPPPGTASTTGLPLLLPFSQQAGLIVNSHPATIHLFIDNTLQSAWSFPRPIVSYSCSYSFSNDPKQKQRQDKENNGILVLLVATEDGSIWNVPLPSFSSLPVTNDNNSSANPGGASSSTNQTTTNKSTFSYRTKSTSRPSSPKIAIKIENDDRINIDDEEEVELWNDEDGLVVDQAFDALDSLLPPVNKRQRTASPPPATAATTAFHGTTTTATESGRRTQVVNKAQHLVGSESNISHIAFIAGDLLIFRYGERLLHWSSRHLFAPHTDVIRQFVLNKAADKLQAVAHISKHLPGRIQDKQEDVLFVATRSFVIYRISILDSKVDIRELFTVKEPVAALLSVPSKPSNQDHSLVVASAKGTVSWSKITQPDQEEGRPVATTPKTFSLDLDVQTAFVTENHLYVLTGPGRVLRLPLESLGSMDNKDLEIMDLPPLCALSLILSHDSTAVEGLYGLNQRGQLLRFPADWTKHARPQGVVNARDTVGRALSELKRLSDQVKRLEIQCQLENQRIATYNRLVFELQQSVLASSSRQDVSHGSSGGEDVEMELDIEPGLLVETSVSTFSHIVSNGFEGTKRFYARLRVKSRANIDWSSGWSVGVNVASKVEFCPHGKPTATSQHNTGTNTRMHHQTFASLRTLNRHSPWTLDIELDREMVHSLPLQVSIGLLFRELGDASGTSDNFKSDEGGFAAYFVLDSVDLDVLDFVEGVEDPLKRDVPAFVQHQPRSRPTTTTNNADSKDEGEQEGCIQCKVEIGDSSDAGAGTEMNKKDAASLFRPIEFEIDTTSIPIAQCLPALLFLEGCDHDGSSRAVKVVDMAAAGGGRKQGMGLGMSVGIEVRMKAQASFRTCFVLPEECLTSSGLPVIRPIIPTSAKQLQGQGHRNTFRIDNDAMAVRSFGKPWGSGVDVAGLTGLAGGHGQIEDPDFGMVWVDLIEGPALSAAAAGSGSGGSYGRQQQEQHGRGQPKEGVVKAHVLVRGSDFERVFVVRQALERRIHALFD